MAAAHPSECAAVVICDRGIGAQMTPAANGTDERLDAVLDVLRAIRAALEAERKPAKSPLKLPTGKVVERKRGGSYRADVVSHNDGKPIFVADPADLIE